MVPSPLRLRESYGVRTAGLPAEAVGCRRKRRRLPSEKERADIAALVSSYPFAWDTAFFIATAAFAISQYG